MDKEPGWIVSHPQYGKWFISRKAVIADWKYDRAQAYPDEPEREPTNEELEVWWSEQTTWVEVAANGKQLERPDMVAIEAMFMRKMTTDTDYLDAESIMEVKDATDGQKTSSLPRKGRLPPAKGLR